MNSFQSIHLQSPPPARTNLMISESDGPANRSVDDVLVKVKPNPHQAFSHFTGHRCHESLFRTTPEISKYKAHDYPGRLRWIYGQLMQFSLVIFRCSIIFSAFWLSQGSAATLIRWGGWSSYSHMCRSFVSLMLKTCLLYTSDAIFFGDILL